MARPRTGSLSHDGRAWRLRVYTGRDLDGRPVRRSVTLHEPGTPAGRKLARARLRELVGEVERGEHDPRRTKGTLAEVHERWVAVRGPDWSARSVADARARFARHVAPTLGAVPVAELRPADIDALYAALRGRLAPATVRRVHIDLHAALAQAVVWDLVRGNPAARARAPRQSRPQARALPAPARLRAAIGDAPEWLRPLLLLAVHTGVRRGDLCALRWADLDLETADGGVLSLVQAKTGRELVVALGPGTVAQLVAWREVVEAQAAMCGAGPPVWVFPSPRLTGRHVEPSSVTHAWGRLRSRHGLDGVRLHDLRHAMATEVVGRTDVTTAQRRGGWSSPAVLLGVYSQRVTERDRAAAVHMERWLDGAEAAERAT